MLFDQSFIFDRDLTHPSCHASVIQELPNKELMAVWYAGKSEAHKTVGLKASWKPLVGGMWSPPILIHKTPGKADGNAVIMWYRDALFLFFDTIHGLAFPWFNTIVYCKKSTDYGRTWSAPVQILPAAPKGITLRNKPLLMGNRLIIPVGNEHLWKCWSNVIITDNGTDFHLSQPITIPRGRSEQPTIVQLGDGRLLAYLRTNQNYVYRTDSIDTGETWSVGERLGLMNPNSALDMTRTAKGELILVWNNNSHARGGMAASRECLNVGYSPDEGQTWPVIKELERVGKGDSVSYPSIIQGSDGIFHVTYSYRRDKIRYLRFDLDFLLSDKSDK